MRRSTYILLVLLMIFLASCSSNEQENHTSDGEKSEQSTEEPTEKQSKKQTEEQTSEESVEVNKGLFNVEITLPTSMFKGEDIDTIIADAKKEGITNVTKNENGSLTYKMSKAKHKEMMKELETGLLASIEEMKSSEGFASIKDITHNDSFSEFSLIVDKGAYENSMDSFAVMSFGMLGMMYQLYSGADTDNSQVSILIKDQATQEVFDEVVYPNDMNEQGVE